MKLWKLGRIDDHLLEYRSIETRLPSFKALKSQDEINQNISNFMKRGKISSALNILSENKSEGVLPLNETTMQQLKIRHPTASPKCKNLPLHGPSQYIDPIIHDNITTGLIKK